MISYEQAISKIMRYVRQEIRKNSKPKPEKKKLETSKKVLYFACFNVLFSYITSYGLNFILSWNDKQQIDFAVPLAMVTAFGGFVVTGYFGLAGWRHSSVNKYGCHDKINGNGYNEEPEVEVTNY